MPYIPEKHRKYDLLPFCRENGGEVFDYPDSLLDDVNKYLLPDDNLYPYGYNSYEEYYQKIDAAALKFKDKPEIFKLFEQLKEKIIKMNCKENWSVLRYIGPDDGEPLTLTPGRDYYWPTIKDNPVYSGVIDDEEFTAYFYFPESDCWEILEDPTGMAYNAINNSEFSEIL